MRHLVTDLWIKVKIGFSSLYSMVIVIDEQEVEDVPDNLEDFFETFPSIGRANMELTGRHGQRFM